MNLRKPVPLLATLCALITFPAAAARADAVDDAARAEMKRLGIPGLSVVIYKGDKLVKKAAYGEADVENHVAATPDHVFETGSIGKALTATLTMQLVGENKLALTDPVSKHFDKAPASWSRITVRDLLAHTSGLPDYALVPGLGLVERWTLDEWVTRITAAPLDFPTGTQHAYSNTNYFLLGLVLEKAGGKPYQEMLTERVLKPAGMTHTRFADPREIIPNRARGYWRLAPQQGGAMINAPEMNGAGPGSDGGLIGTADDLAAFERAFREGKLVPSEVVRKMQTATRLPDKRKAAYGLGWFVREVYGRPERPWLSHGGNTAGFAASVSRFPAQELTVALACNSANVPGDGLAMRLAGALEPQAFAPPAYAESPDPDPKRTTKLRAALSALGRGETKGDAIDPSYTERLATARGRMSAGGLTPLSKIDALAFLEAQAPDPESGDRVLRYRARLSDPKAPRFIVAVVLTRDGRVWDVALRPESA